MIFAVLSGLLAGCGEPEPTTEPAERIIIPTETAAPAETSAPTETEAPTEPAPDYESLYTEILDYFYYFLEREADDGPFPGSIGVAEAADSLGYDRFAGLGCSIRDLSGDGIPELVVGEIVNGTCAAPIALYRCTGGYAESVFEGWSRRVWTPLADGTWYYYGSSGAMYTAAAHFALEPDCSLRCLDYYFSEVPQDGDADSLTIMHNQAGELNSSISEATDLSYDDYLALQSDWQSQGITLDLTPFGEYYPAGEITGNPQYEEIKIQWASQVVDWDYEYDTFYLSFDQEVLLTTPGTLKDFTLLKLTPAGESFKAKELFSWESLSADFPLLLGIDFPGTAPAYGIRFIDEAGQERSFAIDANGCDGSVYLWEFEP